ncbi:hypothetical protein LEP1GSC179_0442 [Leptospira santarosai str. MOR084]|uniref:Uncharacterized protein n=1 Tax=Leptospira santarosai str. MOR084 TaxID=1049984 RepID=A0A0E2BIK5_9LEPT|nr:hypothetical protein LEP1GSC179_0442 [Leptospira santarosai str. MOR084]
MDLIEVLNVFFTQRKFGAKNFLNTSSLRKNKMWEFGSATIVHSKFGNVGVPTNYVLYALFVGLKEFFTIKFLQTTTILISWEFPHGGQTLFLRPNSR